MPWPPEPFDWTNPFGRWEQGAHQIILSIGSDRLFPPLYILTSQYNDQTGRMELRVGDDLTLRNDFTAPQDYKRLGFPIASAGVSAIVERACLSVGLTNYSLSGISGSLPVSPDKPEGSWMQWAQSYLGERGRWLYLTNSGQVRSQAWPDNSTSTLLTRTRSQVDSWDSLFSGETPRERYTCTGATEKLVPADQPNTAEQVEEEIGDLRYTDGSSPPQDVIVGNVVKSRRTYSQSADGLTKRIKLEQCLGELDQQWYPGDTTLVVTSDSTEITTVDSKGRLTQVVTTIYQPLPAVDNGKSPISGDPEATLSQLTEDILKDGGSTDASMPTDKLPYWQNPNVVISTVETFTYGGLFSPDEGVLVERVKTQAGYRRTNRLSYSPMLVEKEVERYDKNTFQADFPKSMHYVKSFYRAIRKRSVKKTQVGATQATYIVQPMTDIERDSQTGQTPPSPPVVQPEYETGAVQFGGVATFNPVSASPYYKREEKIEADTLTNGSECQEYAKLIGTLAHQSYRGRSTNLPIPSEWLADPKPFAVVAIDGVKYIACNDTITLSNDGIELSWQLYKLDISSSVEVRTLQQRWGNTPQITWSAPTVTL